MVPAPTHVPVRRLAATSLILALAVAAPLGGAAAVEAPPVTAPRVTAVPRPQVALPAQLDVRPTYQAGASCDPVARVGATRLGQLLVDTYGAGSFGTARFCDGSTSEHHEGRAVDWMLSAAKPADKAVADAFLAWLTADSGAMARRMGIQYVIWNRAMWRAYAPERGWTPYSGVSPHTDHIHLSLTWDGAMARTSWWSGRTVTTPDVGTCRVYAGQPAPLYSGRRTTPCAPTSSLPRPPASTYPITAIGSRDAATVRIGQAALGVSADGVFGRGTQQAVLNYQRAHGLPATGAFDALTWNSLAPTPAPAPAPAPVRPPVGQYPPVTAPTPTTRPSITRPLPATLVRPLARYKSTVLRPRTTGSAVRALQSTLALPVTGVMDARTVAAVRGVQARWRVPVTGTVNLVTWNRVELTRYPWLGHVGTTLRRGSTGPAVAALQRALRVGADGQFGRLTQAAVMSVQSTYGVPATGIVDEPTWRAISAAAA